MAHPPKFTLPLESGALRGRRIDRNREDVTRRVGYRKGAAFSLRCCPPAVMGVTAIVWVPSANCVVSTAKFQPTLGQPASPGKALHTSLRVPPYIADP